MLITNINGAICSSCRETIPGDRAALIQMEPESPWWAIYCEKCLESLALALNTADQRATDALRTQKKAPQRDEVAFSKGWTVIVGGKA